MTPIFQFPAMIWSRKLHCGYTWTNLVNWWHHKLAHMFLVSKLNTRHVEKVVANSVKWFNLENSMIFSRLSFRLTCLGHRVYQTRSILRYSWPTNRTHKRPLFLSKKLDYSPRHNHISILAYNHIAYLHTHHTRKAHTQQKNHPKSAIFQDLLRLLTSILTHLHCMCFTVNKCLLQIILNNKLKFFQTALTKIIIL